MAQPPPADGLGPTETVKIASAEASTAQYIGLLVVAVAALFNFGAKTLEKWQEQGSVPWLYLIGTLLAGYFTYEGACVSISTCCCLGHSVAVGVAVDKQQACEAAHGHF